MSEKETVLLTGSSGFVGRKVLRALTKRGHPVVALYHQRLPENLDGVYPVCSDMGSAELLSAPLRGVDVVIHLAWQGGMAGSSEYYGSGHTPKNVLMTQNLVQAMEKTGARRIVFLSAMGASRQSKVDYLLEKYMAEFFLLNSRVSEKLIVRTCPLWDEETNPFMDAVKHLLRFPVYPVPQQRDGLALLCVDDLTSVVTDAAFCKFSDPASILEVNGGKNYQLNEVIKRVAQKELGKGRLGIRGIVGNTLVPLFDRVFERDGQNVNVRQFLALRSQVDEHTQRGNSLNYLTKKRYQQFLNL